MEPYILLSPVGAHKFKYLDSFIKFVRLLKPPPEEIVLCVDLDSGFDRSYENVRVLFSPEIGASPTTLDRICSAREILRNYFIYGSYNYALWLDTDIIPPPELPKILYDIMEKHQTLIVVN
ncbi:MAG: hypothetical protein ACTSPB_12590, partial [Candidatus Thorarchaeota archaeon]